jgi:small-conductance mechanosensitive channel
MVETWSNVLVASFQELWGGVIAFVPKLIIALIIFIVGWVIAVVLGRIVAQIVRSLKVDRALQSLGAEEPLSKAGFRLDSGAFVGGLVRWFFIIIFLVAAVDVLGLNQVNEFLYGVVLLYLPNVIVAALILVVAALLADATKKVVAGSAKAADLPSAEFLGGVAKWAIWIFAILAALSHLGIAGVFAQTLFTGVVAMLAIAGGLAFGLGGKDAAARYIERLRKDIGGDRG